MADQTLLLTIESSLILLLLGGNLFFIRRVLIDLDSKATTSSVGTLSGQLREIKADIKDLRRVEIDVAVLKSSLTSKFPKKTKDVDDDGENENDDA